jgi:hypothetical protein
MPSPAFALSGRAPQKGGITIMVALALLVFITLIATGMSRNSFREVVISGTARQGSVVRNAADSGVEWSIYWMDTFNAAGAPATVTSAKLNNLKNQLLADPTLSGLSFDPMASALTRYDPASLPAPPADLLFPSAAGTTQGFTVGLTRMGKLPIADMSQGTGPGAFTPAQGSESKQAPDLWAVRSDAQYKVGSVVFKHAKEAWITTPVP